MHLPVETLRELLSLAASGATIIVEDQLPTDVPGAADLEKRRVELQTLLKDVYKRQPPINSSTKNLRAIGRISRITTMPTVIMLKSITCP